MVTFVNQWLSFEDSLTIIDYAKVCSFFNEVTIEPKSDHHWPVSKGPTFAWQSLITSTNIPLGRVMGNTKLVCQLTNHFRWLSQGGQPFKPCLSWSIQLSKISSLMIEWLYLLRARRRGEELACEFRRNYEDRIPTSNIRITKSEFLLS